MDNVGNSAFYVINLDDNQDYGPSPDVQGNMGNGINITGYTPASGSGLVGNQIISGIFIDKNTLTSSDTVTITFLGSVSGSPLSYYTTIFTGDALKQGVVYPFMIKKVTSSDSTKFKVKGFVRNLPFGFTLPIV